MTRPPSLSCSAAFTIHGLWPEDNNGSYPSNCNGAPFSTNNLPQPLLNQMSCEWVSYTGSNNAFWSYEYGKHGTCALPLFQTQENYFNSTIALNNQYDVNNALIAAGINPQLASSLPTSQVQSALTNYLGSKPVLSCSSSSLLEVWTCVDTSLKAFDCPSSLTGRSCPSTIAFPSGAGVPQKCQQYYNGSTTSAPSSGSPSGSSSGGGTTTAASGAAFVAAGVAAALALAGAVMV